MSGRIPPIIGPPGGGTGGGEADGGVLGQTGAPPSSSSSPKYGLTGIGGTSTDRGAWWPPVGAGGIRYAVISSFPPGAIYEGLSRG
jgi:hypothetical protein